MSHYKDGKLPMGGKYLGQLHSQLALVPLLKIKNSSFHIISISWSSKDIIEPTC